MTVIRRGSLLVLPAGRVIAAALACCCWCGTIKEHGVFAYMPLKGVVVQQVLPNWQDTAASPPMVDIGQWLSTNNNKNNNSEQQQSCRRSMIIFGTHAADFNAIEYGQRLRYYWPLLQKDCGVGRCSFVINGPPNAALELARQVGLLQDDNLLVMVDSTTSSGSPPPLELWSDPTGAAGRAFGVERGWLPDNTDVNPFLKLFGMLWGLGAWATLPAVIGGYIGNPFGKQPQRWIQDALAVGALQGRWPDNALEMEGATVTKNKFDDLPWVGSWKRRPLELATLRLQNMLGISLRHWKELAPDDDALQAGVLTQLGGCLVVDSDGETVLYEWKDPGICAVANFEDIIEKLAV